MASRTPSRAVLTLRQRLGARLRGVRELAGLRNEDLAAALNLSPATVSRIESGDRLIRRDEIDTWMRATGSADSVRDELAALADTAASQISPWPSRLSAGLDRTQQETTELEATAATMLGYEHAVIHGLLQIREYARLVLSMASVGDRAEHLAGKVTARIQRQSVLLDQSKQFTILMTESTLHWRPGSAELQAEQLRHLRAVMALPNVEIGILPLRGQATSIHPEAFQVYADRIDDADTLVVVELVADHVTISEPSSVALYLREFDRLRAGAVYGRDAQALIDRLIADLQAGAP